MLYAALLKRSKRKQKKHSQILITTKKNNKNLKTLINKIETKIKITTETDIFKKDMNEILGLKNNKKKIR